MEKNKPNRLIHATSPYLLQHAFNPVDWHEWNAEALMKAKAEDKPILVSIGYSSCHWCHVMERESFEKPEIAKVMNDHFICIKVDREERPDIDQVYMEAVQAMGGHGGWPLNVFLTPDQKPFYGGTYYPPANFVHLMQQIQNTFSEKRKDIEDNAAQLSGHLATSDLQRFASAAEDNEFTVVDLEKMFSILRERFDNVWGGLEKAPKFVMPSMWVFLLRYYAISKNAEALSMVTHTLIKMQQGGIYDQLGGGFSRYSVDARWFAPHFEKMLYDNAQLLTLYAEAYTITKDPVFSNVIRETTAWIKREMLHPEGGFYSALDADSEGDEGRFYTWTQQEIVEILGKESDEFLAYFKVSAAGNWEHGRNILIHDHTGVTPPHLNQSKIKLLNARAKRIRPALDDKILTGWNAMTVTGLCDAYTAVGDIGLLDLAEANIKFINERLISEGRVYRSYKSKRSGTEGFLEDYAFLIQAYLALYRCTFNESYLERAKYWLEYVIVNFTDQQEGYFHFTGNQAEPLIARKKEIFDNVIPGSNSVMARNLYHLGILLDNHSWQQQAVTMAGKLGNIVRTEPGYLSNWGVLLSEITKGLAEVVIAGPEAESMRKEFSNHFIPFALLLGSGGESELPLFEGRNFQGGKTNIYVCFDKTCQLPVTTVQDALPLIVRN